MLVVVTKTKTSRIIIYIFHMCLFIPSISTYVYNVTCACVGVSTCVRTSFISFCLLFGFGSILPTIHTSRYLCMYILHVHPWDPTHEAPRLYLLLPGGRDHGFPVPMVPAPLYAPPPGGGVEPGEHVDGDRPRCVCGFQGGGTQLSPHRPSPARCHPPILII